MCLKKIISFTHTRQLILPLCVRVFTRKILEIFEEFSITNRHNPADSHLTWPERMSEVQRKNKWTLGRPRPSRIPSVSPQWGIEEFTPSNIWTIDSQSDPTVYSGYERRLNLSVPGRADSVSALINCVAQLGWNESSSVSHKFSPFTVWILVCDCKYSPRET